jgi:hypothetical protein
MSIVTKLITAGKIDFGAQEREREVFLPPPPPELNRVQKRVIQKKVRTYEYRKAFPDHVGCGKDIIMNAVVCGWFAVKLTYVEN